MSLRKRHTRKHPSLWWYYLFLAIVCLAALFISTWYTVHSYSSFFARQLAHLEGVDSESLRLGLELQGKEILYRCIGLSAIVIGLFGIVSFVLYRGLERPLREMRLGAERFAQGDFDRKLPQYHLGEINDLARAMDRMGSQLRHLEEIRSDFVANVSHELKTPITSIKGFVETLLDGAHEEREDLLRFLDIIAKQSERLTQIIDDLLMLARLESGRIEEQLFLQDEFVLPMLRAVVDSAQSLAAAKDISLNLTCAIDLKARFDRSLMEQAVANLVHNAIKYSGTASSVALSASAEAAEGYVELKVSDSGPGIDAQHLPRLFERFYRVDKARSRAVGGTGLGLSIVKHIVGVHQGVVTVESTLGKGSTFIIRLPLES